MIRGVRAYETAPRIVRATPARSTLSMRTGIWLPIEAFVFVIESYFCHIFEDADPHDVDTVEVLAFILGAPAVQICIQDDSTI
jgi:hypothetical protein